MERTMSVEDKIRRAEEIYNRRRENESKKVISKVNADSEKRRNKDINKTLKKMIIQIIICMSIYFIFYYIINGNYVFSEDFKKKAQEILSYDISLSKIYENILNFSKEFEEKYNGFIKKEEDKNQQIESKENLEENYNTENSQNNNTPDNQLNNIQEESNGDSKNSTMQEENEQENLNSEESIQNETEDVGGAVEYEGNKDENEQVENISEIQNLSKEERMKINAEDIKSKVSFIKPLEGRITSNFGPRNPTVSTVSKYHTGIDIAANQGTDIISATNGKVILASSEGAYGNHLKIQIEDVIIIYAHCLSLNVKENDEIFQGQTIAKVGSTGNSTGPHLHFEIRKGEDYIDPRLILEF